MNSLALVLAAATVVAATDSPFIGKWKLNLEKSQFAGTTMTCELLPSGEMRSTAGGQSYTFKTDGKEYPAIFGSTAAWKQLDANTWQATYKLKGTVLSTDTMKVSADGKTLTVSSKGTKPDGASFESTAEYQRLEGESGLTGKWKSTKVAMSSPETMEFTASTGEGLIWTVPAYKISVDLKFDGKDHPVTGPTVPENFTIAVTSRGTRSFEMVEKGSGKVVGRGTYTLSEDGKTLTALFSPEGTNEKVTAVYDRQ
jgi:hypothetical protein